MEKKVANNKFSHINKSKTVNKEVIQIKRQIELLEQDQKNFLKKLNLLTNPESRHLLTEELQIMDENIRTLIYDEKELQYAISHNEVKFSRMEKANSKNKGDIKNKN